MTKFLAGMILGIFATAVTLGGQRLASEKVVPPQVLVDNSKVRMVRWVLKPGEGTPLHSHDLPHVSVVIHGSTIHAVSADGKVSDTHDKTGEAEFVPGGQPRHSFSNVGTETFESISIELKK
jgi:quercetin dioxygenase-like cupin family protein